MVLVDSSIRTRRRPGITLVEILIAILILGVGLASLATLFPIGLLRLREAARSTRSAYLMESAAADLAARGLLTSTSFSYADQFNLNYSSYGLIQWFTTSSPVGGQVYTPLTQDTPGYYQDWMIANSNPPPPTITIGANSANSGGYGLPFAYDPLWRYQTPSAIFQDANGNPLAGYQLGEALEARFGSGIGFIAADPSDGNPPSAHGLQRLTNFNRPYILSGGQTVPIMPIATGVPNIFVSPEDVVWQEPTNNNYKMPYTGNTLGSPSPVLPDMSIATNPVPSMVNDWHYSWMFTGQQNNSSAGSSFEGNIVIFENRAFNITVPTFIPGPVGNFQAYQVSGETVVEAIYGASKKVSSISGAPPGFGVGADRSVLLRWYASEPDPVVRVGDFFADVTYERNALVVQSRFLGFAQYNPSTGTASGTTGGLQNPFNNYEWDNLPAQRCFWYRVQKIVPATADPSIAGMRSMVVYTDRSLQARTVVDGTGNPVVRNAALICPSVVNVIPQTIFTK